MISYSARVALFGSLAIFLWTGSNASAQDKRPVGPARRRPNRRWPPRLARVSYRSKSRRGGCKSWWLLMTQMRVRQEADKE
jgi:hypothetical protein